MTPPHEPLTRQRRRHSGPMIGLIVVVLAVILMLIWWIGYEFEGATNPTSPDAQIDSRTGDTVQTDPAVTPTPAPDAATPDTAPDAVTEPNAAPQPVPAQPGTGGAETDTTP